MPGETNDGAPAAMWSATLHHQARAIARRHPRQRLIPGSLHTAALPCHKGTPQLARPDSRSSALPNQAESHEGVDSRSATNLKCLCRHHHRAKTFRGWRDKQLADGTVIWASPTGRIYRTSPAGADLFPQPGAPACVAPTPSVPVQGRAQHQLVLHLGQQPARTRSAAPRLGPNRTRPATPTRRPTLLISHLVRTAGTPPLTGHGKPGSCWGTQPAGSCIRNR